METTREALWNIAFFVSVILAAMLVDWGLHLTGHMPWGRYFGYVGSGLLVLSFLHSARKRRWIQRGSAPFFLRLHEFLSWFGAMLILVHGGIHFNALLPWLAMGSMLVAVASGLTGKYLLKKSRGLVSARRQSLLDAGADAAELADRLYWDALVVDLMKKWRTIHLPITTLFAVLTTLHVVTVLLFWRW